MSKIIVSGSIAYDRIMDYQGLFADSFVLDKLHSINLSFLVDKLSVEFGGTAGNIAYSLAMLSENPQIIATAGVDFSQYRSHLLLSGVEPSSIRVLDDELPSSAYVLTDKADNQIAAFHPGAGGHAYDIPINIKGSPLAIIAPGCVPDMTSLPDYYRKNRLRYVYDPGQAIPSLSADALRDGMMGAHVLFASDYEFGLIAQKTGWAEGVILEHASTIVITYGSEGSRIKTREGEWRTEAAPVKEVNDPTGAGDAYRAGFIKGMLLGLSALSCAQLGSVVAAYAVEEYGTQTHKFTLPELAQRYRKAYGEELSI